MLTTKITGGKNWQEYIKKQYLQLSGKPQVRVGILDGATYSQDHNKNFIATKTLKNGKKKKVAKARKEAKAYIPKIIEVAFWNEFGTKKAPERSFLRSTLREKSTEWTQSLAKLMKVMPMEQALEQLGNIMVDDVVQKIKSGIEPALSEYTLELRKANNIEGNTPLMASREMITSIASEVNT